MTEQSGGIWQRSAGVKRQGLAFKLVGLVGNVQVRRRPFTFLGISVQHPGTTNAPLVTCDFDLLVFPSYFHPDILRVFQSAITRQRFST